MKRDPADLLLATATTPDEMEAMLKVVGGSQRFVRSMLYFIDKWRLAIRQEPKHPEIECPPEMVRDISG